MWKSALGVVAMISAVLLGVVFAGNAGAAATSVPLGTASSFAILAGAGITNTGSTTVTGDVGTFPTTSISGAASLTINGTNHGGDSVTQQAKTDLITGYTNAAGQGPTSPVSADLGGQTLVAGVYNSASSLGLTGKLTLDGKGDANAVFVFQSGSTLTTASASQVTLINGAQPCNVFWQVGSSATLGTGSSFLGTILALQDITVTNSVTVNGRVLARNGAVTLDTDTISASACTTTTTPTTAGSTTTSTVAASASTTPSVIPTGAPHTGAGGASQSGPNVLFVALGGAALLGAGAASTQALRRRRILIRRDGRDT
jgi:hypothetical protein